MFIHTSSYKQINIRCPTNTLINKYGKTQKEISRYKNGQIEFEEWYKNGKLHRTNSHAIISYFENGYINQSIMDLGSIIELQLSQSAKSH